MPGASAALLLHQNPGGQELRWHRHLPNKIRYVVSAVALTCPETGIRGTMSSLIAIKYDRGSGLSLLDQRKLPFETTWLATPTPQDAWQQIKDMVVRGAPVSGSEAALSRRDRDTMLPGITSQRAKTGALGRNCIKYCLGMAGVVLLMMCRDLTAAAAQACVKQQRAQRAHA